MVNRSQNRECVTEALDKNGETFESLALMKKFVCCSCFILPFLNFKYFK